MKDTTEERFWAKVNKTASCWEWTAAQQGAGYGYIKAWGSMRLAHRVSYELANGPIPEGMVIDHICHNRACVNPGHLRLATRKQNNENQAGLSSTNKSGIRGVSWCAGRNKWAVYVSQNDKTQYFGLYESIVEAEAVAIAARNELFTHNDLDRAA